MQRPQALLLSVFLASALHATSQSVDATPATSTPTALTQSVADSTTSLGIKLLNKAIATGDGNVVISPLSIDECLGLLYNGASGDTQTKFASSLGLDGLDRDAVNKGFSEFRSQLQGSTKGELNIGNALWVAKKHPVNSGFSSRCSEYFGASTNTEDFDAPDAVATKINQWVDTGTNHQIPKIVDGNDLKGKAAVLTNAVYFKASWREPFETPLTRNEAFNNGGDGLKSVPMMNMTSNLKYYEDDTIQAVDLPYADGSTSMLIVLPRESSDIKTWVSGLDTAEWKRINQGLQYTRVHLELPRVKTSYTDSDLKSTLSGIGLPLSGDYSDTGIPEFKVDTIIHVATLDIDEAGTVAAAATAIMATAGAAPAASPVEMIVDQPYYFAIQDDNTHATLFAGVIRDPS